MRFGAVMAIALTALACGRPTRVFVGTYTGAADSRGIYRVDFDQGSGRFASEPVLAAEAENPSFLVVSPDGRFVFAVNELWRFKNERSGAVSAFRVDASTGQLSLINQQPSGGINPCFIGLDAEGRHALVANYTSGSVAVLPIGQDGTIAAPVSVRGGTGSGPVTDRQDGPHAHHLVLDATKRFALWTDLGADWVAIDHYDASSGKLEPARTPGIRLPPGSGPRHLAWHPSGRVVYVLNELSSTVMVLRFDPTTGGLAIGQSISARAVGATAPNTAAEIAVAANGKFVYASNRGDDTVAVFAVDANTLDLSLVTHVSSGGRKPRHFTIDPSGKWLIVANQDSAALVVFRLDAATGIPAPTPATVTIPSPVNVVFSPSK